MAAVTSYHKTGSLKRQKCILIQCWRPEICNHGVDRAALPLKALCKDLFFASFSFGGYWHSLTCDCVALTFASGVTGDWHQGTCRGKRKKKKRTDLFRNSGAGVEELLHDAVLWRIRNTWSAVHTALRQTVKSSCPLRAKAHIPNGRLSPPNRRRKAYSSCMNTQMFHKGTCCLSVVLKFQGEED